VRVRLGVEVARVMVLVLVGVGLERLEAAGRIQVGSEEAGVFHFFLKIDHGWLLIIG
jgi:hypothetical protein